jgi:hypothetical protein
MATPSVSIRLNDSNRFFHDRAKILKKSKEADVAYGTADGLVTGYGVIKSIFEVENYGASQIVALDEMHKWMAEPIGLSISVVTTLFFVTLSTLGNLFSEDDANLYKKNTILFWKYTRELIQALRNSFKALRTTMLTLTLCCACDLRFLIIPLSLSVGLIYTLSRLAFLSIQDARKKRIKHNQELYAFLSQERRDKMNLPLPTDGETKIESVEFSMLCLVAKAYNGLLDSLYLYINILTLVPLSPSFLLIAGVFSVAYCLLCIATRVYEEYESQRELAISAYKVNAIRQAHALQLAINERTYDLIPELARTFEESQKLLLQINNLPVISIILLGAKRGIAAYGAVLMLLSSIAIMSTFWFGLFFSPAIVLGFIVSGVPIIVGFILNTYWEARSTHHYIQQQDAQLTELMETVTHITADQPLSPEQTPRCTQLLSYAPDVAPMPSSYATDVIEIGRSSGSAILKGRKIVEFLLNNFQEKDADGHYQDTPFMVFLVAPVSALFAVCFALRAFVKGYSKEPPSTYPEPLKKPEVRITQERATGLFGHLLNQLDTRSPETQLKGVESSSVVASLADPNNAF